MQRLPEPGQRLPRLLQGCYLRKVYLIGSYSIYRNTETPALLLRSCETTQVQTVVTLCASTMSTVDTFSSSMDVVVV